MPDGSKKMVYGANESKRDWERKRKIKYDNFYKDIPEENPLDQILLKDEISEWLDFIKATCVEKTFDEYTWLVNKHLLPYIGEIKMVDVTTAVAIDVANKVKQTSSAKLAERVNKRLNSILNWHVERERGLQVNPISKIVQKDLSREIARDEEFDTEPVISLGSVQRFLNYFIDSHLLIVFSFMALCGLRIAEAVAVTWEDIDFDANVIYIHQQISDKGKLTKTKTKASIRYVPLPTSIKPLLLKIFLEEKRTGFVTLNSHGTPIRPNNLRYQHFHRARQNLEEQYPDFDIKTPHQFRKFFISFHLDNGTNLENVARWAGHSDSSITQKIYAKPINETRNYNSDLMSEVMGNQSNKPHLLSIESNNRFDKYSSRPKVAIYK